VNLRQKVAGGLFWAAVSSVSVQVVGFVSSAVLARLLTPYDFGLLEIALVFFSISAIIGDFGFGQALVQWAGSVREAASTGFFAVMGLSLVAAVLLVTAAPAVAAFYNQAEVAWILRALALSTILTGIGVIPSSLLEKELGFRRKTSAEVAPQVAYAFVAIGLAYAGFGVSSLVAGLLVAAFLRALLLWQRAGFRPHLCFDWVIAGRLVSFGRYLAFISLLLYATSKLDVVYLAYVADAADVGYYGLAVTITNLAVDLVASLFGRVTFPAFSALQDDVRRVGRAYLRAVSFMTYAAFPIAAGLFAVAPAAVVGIYGEDWAPAVPLVRILCLFALIRALSRLTGSIFTSTGRPDVTTRIVVVRLAMFGLLLLALGSIAGTPGVAWAAAVSMTVAGLWAVWLTNRHLGIPQRRFLSAVGPQLTAAVLMGAVVTVAGTFLPTAFGALAALVPLGVLVYLAFLFLLQREGVRRDWSEILALLQERLAARRRGQ